MPLRLKARRSQRLRLEGLEVSRETSCAAHARYLGAYRKAGASVSSSVRVSLSLSLSRLEWCSSSLTSVLSLLLIRGTVHPFRGQVSDSMVHPCRSLSESLPTLSSVPFPAVIALDSTSFGTWYSSHLERALVGSPGSPPKGQGWRNRHRPDSKKQEKVRGARRQPGARGGGREGGCPRREGRGAEGRGLR